jgi:hypothetical protein
MKVQILVRQSGQRSVQAVGDFKLNGVYLLVDGYHRGKMLRLNYISPNKQVIIAGTRHRMISGTLVGETVKINSILAYLQ